MTLSFAPLPRRCPIGFAFDYAAREQRARGKQPRRMTLVGWLGASPLFSDGDRDDLTGSALETAAALAFREHELSPVACGAACSDGEKHGVGSGVSSADSFHRAASAVPSEIREHATPRADLTNGARP